MPPKKKVKTGGKAKIALNKNCAICGKNVTSVCNAEKAEASSTLLKDYLQGLRRHVPEEIQYIHIEDEIACQGCSQDIELVKNWTNKMEVLQNEISELERTLQEKLTEMKSTGQIILLGYERIENSSNKKRNLNQNNIFIRKGTEQASKNMKEALARLKDKPNAKQFNEDKNAFERPSSTQQVVSVTSSSTQNDGFEAGEIFLAKTEMSDDEEPVDDSSEVTGTLPPNKLDNWAIELLGHASLQIHKDYVRDYIDNAITNKNKVEAKEMLEAIGGHYKNMSTTFTNDTFHEVIKKSQEFFSPSEAHDFSNSVSKYVSNEEYLQPRQASKETQSSNYGCGICLKSWTCTKSVTVHMDEYHVPKDFTFLCPVVFEVNKRALQCPFRDSNMKKVEKHIKNSHKEFSDKLKKEFLNNIQKLKLDKKDNNFDCIRKPNNLTLGEFAACIKEPPQKKRNFSDITTEKDNSKPGESLTEVQEERICTSTANEEDKKEWTRKKMTFIKLPR